MLPGAFDSQSSARTCMAGPIFIPINIDIRHPVQLSLNSIRTRHMLKAKSMKLKIAHPPTEFPYFPPNIIHLPMDIHEVSHTDVDMHQISLHRFPILLMNSVSRPLFFSLTRVSNVCGDLR